MMHSIIVPVYNSEKYLDKCLLSLSKQTYNDYEVILVDDGSTDSSGKICDSYSSKDSHFKVYHKPNQGVSSARNLGLSVASGDYVSFVDSDDWVDETYCEIISKQMKGSDLLFFCAEKFSNSYITAFDFLGKNLNDEEIGYVQKLIRTDYFGYTWNKVIRKSIIESYCISFKEDLDYREDELFAYRLLPHVNKIVVIEDILYHYRLTNTGLTYKKKNYDVFLRYLKEVSCAVLPDIQNVELTDLIKNKLINEYFLAFVNAPCFSQAINVYRNAIAYITDNHINYPLLYHHNNRVFSQSSVKSLFWRIYYRYLFFH